MKNRQALRDDAMEPAELPEPDHVEPAANDPMSPCTDDATTLILGEHLTGDVANEGDLEESASTTSESSNDDVPNIPADSRGNTSHGFNLDVFNVGPVPPTPSSEGHESSEESEESEIEEGDSIVPPAVPKTLVTPPPKRAAPVSEVSSTKMPKVEVKEETKVKKEVKVKEEPKEEKAW